MFIYNGGLLLHFAIMLDKRAGYYERAMVAKDHMGSERPTEYKE
jgi:hypothetical protein